MLREKCTHIAFEKSSLKISWNWSYRSQGVSSPELKMDIDRVDIELIKS